MKKIEIYLKDELILSILVEKYEITQYTSSVDIEYVTKEVKATYSIPLNKGYRIVADI